MDQGGKKVGARRSLLVQKQSGRVPGLLHRHVRRHLSQVLHVLGLACGFPEVVIVVARQVVDQRAEQAVSAKGQIDEEFEDGVGDDVRRQGQVENVAGENERGWFVLVPDQSPQPFQQGRQQRARRGRIGLVLQFRIAGPGSLVDRGQQAVLSAQMEIRKDDVADLTHFAAPPGRRPDRPDARCNNTEPT